MSDKKAPNYTEAQTDEMVQAYNEATTDDERETVVQDFAENFGKTVRSIRQKLVREKVYVKKERKTKAGDSVERKATIVSDIADLLEIEPEQIESLEKATKTALQIIRGEFSAAKAILAGEAKKPDSE